MIKKEKKSKKFGKFLRRFIPITVFLGSALSTHHVQSSFTENRDDNNGPLIELAKKHAKLPLAEAGSADAYSQSVAQISIDTETGDLANPPAVATGNGYFGQHQLGNAPQNGHCVKKYIAYALVNGSDEFKKSICNNILHGSQQQKDKLIKDMAASIADYKDNPEDAYRSSNKAFKDLFNSFTITPQNFKLSHINFIEEAGKLQRQFIFDIYCAQIKYGFKEIMQKNPQIKFETLHPAIIGSAVAIAVKQGNGTRFKNAMDEVTLTAYKEKALHAMKADTTKTSKAAPLVVACRKGKLSPENIVVTGNIIRIYDPENSGLKSEDILVDKNHRACVIRGEKPQNVSIASNIAIFDMQTDEIDVTSITNNEKWLTQYCRGFNPVLKRALKQLNKVPTLDTYKEISDIFQNPKIYKQAEKLQKHTPISIYAFNKKFNESYKQVGKTQKQKPISIHAFNNKFHQRRY